MGQEPGLVSRSLSILHFSTSDAIGGSGRSAYRIHSGLRERGHRSKMLVGFRSTDDPDVQTISGSKSAQFFDRISNKLSSFLGYQYQFVPSNRRIPNHPWVRDADVIQLFNTHGGYFEQGLLPKLGREAHLVWRLSDLWPFTGHCAYPGDCDGWLSGCSPCPFLEKYPSIGRDRAGELFELKEQLYDGLPLTVVAPSSWIEKQVRRSPLMGRFPVRRIPNGLDGTVYAPRSRSEARRRLGLPPDVKLILFVAHILDGNPRKGGDVLIKALAEVAPDRGWGLALVGEGGESWLPNLRLPVYRLGFRSDPRQLADCYAAADVVAIPSELENLPNTLIEALACGRAVVASDCGGIRDGVIEGKTGFLTATGDHDSLREGLARVMECGERKRSMEEEARRLFEREFDASVELERFQSLYLELAGC